MKIKILAADSMGVRSMATLVETSDVKILIDPAADLAPKRFGLPPHELEYAALENSWKNIVRAAMSADVVIITHYHYDHHSPEKFVNEIYRNKIVLVKDPTRKINESQRERARIFLGKIKNIAKRIEIADGKILIFGDTVIWISEPVVHGIDNKLGFVLQVYIEDSNKSFLFSSDVQGYVKKEQFDFVMKMMPDIIFVDGPPTYLSEAIFSRKYLVQCAENLKFILDEINPKLMILDHHLPRDLDFKKRLSEIFSYANVKTAAEFLGKPNNLLEAQRRELWKKS